ncbi:sulfotransferase domain-containing protein [Candidatus Pelagibacter bacterium nBUS_32]|uniref:sulfotransferase domain-containing protein n=1 Tax=Candidatus Pelagibacter bacterium nBUS_32 TaxID=3374192 RepID=UPI003EBC4088
MIFWIASYPKSGNTWLRSLLSSYYYSEDGIFNQKLLEKIGQFPEKKYFTNFNYNSSIVTDTSKFWISAQDKINADKKLRFFKTHNILGAINESKFTNSKNTIGCIYIVRDPRNVITSLKNHYEIDNEEALKFMLSENKFIYDFYSKNDYSDFQFISSWEKNYKSWIKQNIIPVKLIKYENLFNDTFGVFKNIIEFINKLTINKVEFDPQKARNSIQSSSFDKLKKIEETDGFLESVLSKNESKKIPFFHLGPLNDWRKIYDENYQKKLNLKFNTGLNELKYI